MAIPTEYKWDDGNAPVMSGVAGSIVTLFKKCLVDGYGTKSGAGWTLAFENLEGTKAVFRNNSITGRGVFIRVDDTSATEAVFTAYELMTDVDTGLGPFLSSGSLIVIKSAAAGATMRPWVLVATDKFFYLVTRPSDTSVIVGATQTFFLCFGDFIPFTTEGYNSLIGFGKVIQTNHYGFGRVELAAASVGVGLSSSRALNGAPGLPKTLWAAYGSGLTRFTGPGATPTTFGGVGAGGYYLGPAYDGTNLFIGRPIIGDGSTYDIRGWLPGLYAGFHNYNAFNQFQTIVNSNRTFLSLKIDGAYASQYYGDSINSCVAQFFVEIGDWDVA